MSQVKILWVQDEHNGPMNGLAEYKGEKVWFSRINNPSVVSSTEIPVPYVNTENEEAEQGCKEDRMYLLYRLSEENMIAVVQNHVNHCEETGAPLNHGDPFKIRKSGRVIKTETTPLQTMLPESKEPIEAEMRPLSKVIQFTHKLIPSEVCGEFITTIKESEFINYLIPRRVE